MNSFFADLHIHIGRNWHGKPVKITGSKTLTLTNVLKEASRNKGLDMIGVIDCHSPEVLAEVEDLISKGIAYEKQDGGIQFEEVTLILGSEIEIYDENCKGPIHVLAFLPTLKEMERFSKWLSERITNIHLSSQRFYGTAKEFQYEVKALGGLFIPAHVFTPFKSLFGKGVRASLSEVLDPDLIDAIELGLSADTKMADSIAELHRYTYVSNSDAHSLAKIAREYQKLTLDHPSFTELEWALHQVKGRVVQENYGLNPLLGKYHKTVCATCFKETTEQGDCSCGGTKIIRGVSDRIQELATAKEFPERPDYLYQVPLEYIPTLGKKTLEKLLQQFGTEMNILHRVKEEELQKVVSSKIVDAIMKMRSGKLSIRAGGGGIYGKVNL
ncbi:endonuclease Q family protein [Radiobacillus kanasensis]|uniref:endonuclease Q family protein n=1 Tax=Radiobacillus kanasensis TaxID=2844358 RepID=UPI001E3C0496|nr:endonuclease Q family protein [Radiobacillus kanasensis]UFT97693.1 endonuclease Q family protein [Radiobacillus kanasensis]